jgi:hypothetical protein
MILGNFPGINSEDHNVEVEMSEQKPFTRPTNIEDMHKRMENFSTEEGWKKGLAYQPESTDVYIVTPPKCGTTWMQQIVHGLRTRGSMDFDDITRVVPWINMAHDMGIDIHAPQVAAPRAFKTHTPLNELPGGGKYIVVLRNPYDALLSHYRFFEGMFFEKGSIDITTFARGHYIPGRDLYKHILAIWDHRKNENVLVLCFETMKADLADTIEKVAKFMDLPLDDELKQIVLKQSDIKFMQKHEAQFNDTIIFEKIRIAMQLPLDSKLQKVRTGNVGDATLSVPDEIKNELDLIWQNEIAPVTGLNSYEDLRKELMLM